MKLGKIWILCPKCGLDRGKEVCGIGTACPGCGFTPQSKPKREASRKVVGKETLLDWKAVGVSLSETKKVSK